MRVTPPYNRQHTSTWNQHITISCDGERCGEFKRLVDGKQVYGQERSHIKLFKRQFAHWFEILNKAGWKVCHAYMRAPTEWNYDDAGTDFFLCPNCAAGYIPVEKVNPAARISEGGKEDS